MEIDDINRSIRKQKQEIDLTFTEFEILYLLANNPGREFRGKTRRNKTMIKILFICHGTMRTFYDFPLHLTGFWRGK